MATRNGSGAAPKANWGHHWKSSDRNDESNGLITTLWADLRGRQLPKADRSEDEVWYEEEQARRRAFSAAVGLSHNIDPDRRESFRRRYWA